MKEKIGNKNSVIPSNNTVFTEYIKSKLNSFLQTKKNTNIIELVRLGSI